MKQMYDELKKTKEENRTLRANIGKLKETTNTFDTSHRKCEQKLKIVKKRSMENRKQLLRTIRDLKSNDSFYCTICLENIACKSNYINLLCGHKFHLPCYISNISSGLNIDKCCTCRARYDVPSPLNIIIDLKQEIENLNETLDLQIEDIEDLRVQLQLQHQLQQQYYINSLQPPMHRPRITTPRQDQLLPPHVLTALQEIDQEMDDLLNDNDSIV